MLSNFYASVSITSLCFEKLQLIFLISHLSTVCPSFSYIFRILNVNEETTNDKIAAIALRKIEQQISFSAVGNHAFFKT